MHMDASAENNLVVLFIGGPLHGTSLELASPPDYYPYTTMSGMVPYSRTCITTVLADAIYAPVGMKESAVIDALETLAES